MPRRRTQRIGRSYVRRDQVTGKARQTARRSRHGRTFLPLLSSVPARLFGWLWKADRRSRRGRAYSVRRG